MKQLIDIRNRARSKSVNHEIHEILPNEIMTNQQSMAQNLLSVSLVRRGARSAAQRFL